MTSFIGDQYQPDLKKNRHSYLEDTDLRLQWKTTLPEEMDFLVELRTKDKLSETSPSIYRAILGWTTTRLVLNYEMGYLRIGDQSRIINRNMVDPDYDYPLMQNYRFDGIKARWNIQPEITFFGQAGGNKYHTVLSRGGVNFHKEGLSIDLYSLYAGRSSEDNKRTIIGGTDIFFDGNWLYLNLAANYHWNIEDEYDYYRLFGEIILSPYGSLEVGGNYFYKDLFYEKKVTRGLLAIHPGRLDISLIQLYSETEFELFNDYMRQSSFILMCRCNELMRFGFNINYLNPNEVDEYFNIGIQFEFAYEME